jgi:hypothetical protein
MATFNRNIITAADIAALKAPADNKLPKSLAVSPPSGPVPQAAEEIIGAATTADVPVPTADDYLTKLLKFVPLEVLGAYLFMAGVIDSNVAQPHDHALWLGGLLVGTLILAIAYDIRVLGIVRATQIIVSIVGLAVYVFAVGGWFATTTWYHQWYASIVLPVFGLLIGILKLRPLPTAPVS